MAVQQRGSKYRVIVSLGVDPTTGRKMHAPVTTWDTRQAAEAENSRLLAERALKNAKVAERGTVLDLLVCWYESKDWQSDGHRQRARHAIDVYLKPLHARPVRFLTVIEVVKTYDALRARGLSEPTVRKAHQTMRSALKWGVQRGWCIANVAADVDFSDNRLRTERVECPTQTEVSVLLAKTRGPNWHLLLRFASETGARRGELCALNWDDIDLENQWCRIDESHSYVGKGAGVRAKGPKSHNGVRTIGLSAGLCALLAAERSRQLSGPVVKLSGAHSRAPVFLSTGGVRYTPHALTSRFQKYRNGLELRHIHLHSLRHFAATTMLSAGVPLHEVAAVLGDDMNTVARTYRHVLPGTGRAAAAAWDRVFG